MLKPNAFVEPNNPSSYFPQIAKPNIQDFRSHKMAKGGWTGMYNFRKIHSENAHKSKYPTVVKTKEDLEKEEIEQEHNQDMEDEESEEEKVQVATSKAAKKDKKSNAYTIDDIMELDSKLTIGKKKKQSAPVVVAKKDDDKKKEKKKVFTKKSKKIIKF